jgi:DedD protein
MREREKSVSTRQLLLIFLAGVAVCGVFFALGFLVGYNQRSGRSLAAETERVAVPARVSPPQSSPAENPAPATPPEVKPVAVTDAVTAAPPKDSKRLDRAAEQLADIGPLPEAEKSDEPALNQSKPAKTHSSGTAGIFLQVAALGSHREATKILAKLHGHGYPAVLLKPHQTGHADKLFRVQVGPYGSRADADSARQKIASLGYKPFIIRQDEQR